jgi:PAS domain S-box-containing protein
VGRDAEQCRFIMAENDPSNRTTSPLENHAGLEQAELILRSIADAVFIMDMTSVVTYWNDAATRLFGWSAEETLGRPYADRYPPERRAAVNAQFLERAAGSDWEGETEFRRKDGQAIWIRGQVRVIRDSGGQPVGILTISHDITAQKAAQRTAELQAALERAVLDSLPAHVAVLDADGNIRAVNQAWQRFAAENAGPAGTLIRPTDVGASYLAVCRKAVDCPEAEKAADGILGVLHGQRDSYELEYPCHSESERRWFRMTVTPLRYPGGGAVVAHSNISALVLSEENSRQQSERLQLALEAAQMGVWAVEVGGTGLSVTPGVEKILQRANFPVDLPSLREVIDPQDARVMDAKMERCIAERGRFEGSFRIYREDGAVRWLHNFAQVQLGHGGEPQRVVGTVQDITAARLGSTTLRRQNLILQQIVQGAPLSSVLSDITRLIEEHLPGTLCSILVHDRRRRVLRHGAAPSLPDTYNRGVDGLAIGPENGACGSAAFHQKTVLVRDVATDPLFAKYADLALGHGLRTCLSLPILSGDPGRAHVDRLLGTFAVYRRTTEDPDGSFAAFASALELDMPSAGLPPRGAGSPGDSADFEDWSRDGRKALANATYLAGLAIERQQTLQDMQASEERFRLLVDGITEHALMLVDPRLRIRTWNDGARRIFGYSESEAIDLHVEELYIVEERATDLLGQRMVVLMREGRIEFEGWRRRKDGSQFWGTTVASVLRDDDGGVRGQAVVIRDLTEKRRMEEQLRQSQKMDAIGRLAGGVAHDFNNLLMIINGHAELLRGSLGDDPELAEAVMAIRDAGDRAATLTGQLLAFSRKAMVEPKLIDLNAIVGSAGRMLQRLLGEDIRLSMQLAPQLGRVRLDPGQLDQILLNLAANARDAMPQGGVMPCRRGARCTSRPRRSI